MGEKKLVKLSDAFDAIRDEQADAIASHLNMAIELIQDGESKYATSHMNKFNKACQKEFKLMKKQGLAEAKLITEYTDQEILDMLLKSKEMAKKDKRPGLVKSLHKHIKDLEKKIKQAKKESVNEADYKDVSDKFKKTLDNLPDKGFTRKNIEKLIQATKEKRPDAAMAYAKAAFGWIGGGKWLKEGKLTEIRKGDYVGSGTEVGLVNKVSGQVAYVKFDSRPKSFHPILIRNLTKTGKKHKGKDLYEEGIVTEAKKVTIGQQFNADGITWEVTKVGATQSRAEARTKSVYGKQKTYDNKTISKFAESKITESVKPIKLSGNLKKDLNTVTAMAVKMVDYAKDNFNTYIPTGEKLSQLKLGGTRETDVLKYNINHLAKAINTDLKKKYMKDFVAESVNEAKFNKRTLMKAMKKDDGIITVDRGKQYIIYNPKGGNDYNTDMWQDKVIFGLDQDGEEHEIKYSDIVRYDESRKINLKQDHLSSEEYQKAKKLKDFDKEDWTWNSKSGLYDRVNEATDLNDPVLVSYRATRKNLPKFKPAKAKSRRLSFDKYMDLLDARLDIDQQIKDLRDEMSQTLRDMEQEAEPEGGEIADEYGSTMMKQETEYAKLMAKKDKIMARIDKHRMA